MYKNIETKLVHFIYFFSLLFIYSSNIPTFFFTIKKLSLLIVGVCLIYFLYKMLLNTKKQILIIKENKTILLILFIFFILYNVGPLNFENLSKFITNTNLTESISGKQSCKNLPSFICKSWSIFYFIYLLLIFFIFKNFKNINFSKVFINSSIIFSFIGIVYFLFILILSQIDFKLYSDIQHLLSFGQETVRVFPHFSVTYTPSSRNYEIFPIIIGKLFLIYEIYLNKTKVKNYFYLCLLSIFIFYSYSRLMWLMDGAMLLGIFFSVTNKMKILRIIFINIMIIIFSLGFFTYIYNYSKLLKWDTRSNIRTHITYYTLGKVSTLVSKDLENFFYLKNYKIWHYYTSAENMKLLNDKNFQFNNDEEKKKFFEDNVKEVLTFNMNSNMERKQIYKQAIEKLFLKPEGYGFGKIPIRGSNVESGILQIALEIGVIGVIVFLIILFYPIRLFVRTENLNNNFFIIFMILIIISQTLTVYIWYNFFWFYLGFIISNLPVKKLT